METILFIVLCIAFLPVIIGLGKFLGLVGSQVLRFILIYGGFPILVLINVYLNKMGH